MNSVAHTRSARALSFAQWVGALAFCASASVLAGWQFGISSLTSVLPAWPQMVALSAVAFALAAASLWLQARAFAAGEALTDRRSRVARACAVLVAIVGLAGLIAWALGWDLRLGSFDWLRTSADVAAMESMSAASALAFVLLGGALLLARSPDSFARIRHARS